MYKSTRTIMAHPEHKKMTVTVTNIPHAHMTYMHRRKPPSNRATACRRATLASLGVLLVGMLFVWLAYGVSNDQEAG